MHGCKVYELDLGAGSEAFLHFPFKLLRCFRFGHVLGASEGVGAFSSG